MTERHADSCRRHLLLSVLGVASPSPSYIHSLPVLMVYTGLQAALLLRDDAAFRQLRAVSAAVGAGAAEAAALAPQLAAYY